MGMFSFLIVIVIRSSIAISSSAVPCVPPPNTVATKLVGYFAYHNSFRGNTKQVKHFSVVRIGNRFFFRDRSATPDTGQHAVYAFDPNRIIEPIPCKDDANWIECANDWISDIDQYEPPEKRSPATTVQGPPCEYNLDIPQWKPSEDNQLKRQFAADILRELLPGGMRGYRSVFVRDFNLNDPNIDFYLINARGNSEFRGCNFDRTRQPHCVWHLYGQAPLDSLKENVMEMPYRLYPAPIRKP
jgi:hypothetical protein